MEGKGMKFKHFLKASKGLAIAMSIDEYRGIKSLLKESYTEKQLEDVDNFCKYAPSNTKFLLCNPHKVNEIHTPMMYHNAVTFVDRVPFTNVEF